MYDRFVAKMDTHDGRELLPFVRSTTSVSRGVVDQWSLVNVMCEATMLVTKDVWRDSADACNMNITAAVSFDAWLERIKPHLQAGATFKSELPTDKFWMLPSLWHSMAPTRRTEVIAVIDKHDGM